MRSAKARSIASWLVCHHRGSAVSLALLHLLLGLAVQILANLRELAYAIVTTQEATLIPVDGRRDDRPVLRLVWCTCDSIHRVQSA